MLCQRYILILYSTLAFHLILQGFEIVNSLSIAAWYDDKSIQLTLSLLQAQNAPGGTSLPTQIDVSTERIPLPIHWNVSNPNWPHEPPKVRSDCKVIFRDPSMQLCHIIPWGQNFGDEIGPPVTKRILELLFQCSTEDLPTFDMAKLGKNIRDRDFPCLMTVGSLWRMIVTGDLVWGTGAYEEGVVRWRCKPLNPRKQDQVVKNLTFYSSRGPKSAADIQKYCSFAKDQHFESAGDAGFLVPFLFPEIMESSSNASLQYCAIPHHQDRMSSQFLKVPAEQLYTVQQSWVNMTLALQKCQQVISTSLHGVIIAEALGIPQRRLRLSKKPGDFKFADFYESYRGAEKQWATDLDSALTSVEDPLPMDVRDAYARRILKTFPIHLFDVVKTDNDIPQELH